MSVLEEQLEERLNRPWFNQLGSRLDLRAEYGGLLSGTFRSAVGGIEGSHALTGFFSPDADGRGATVGFAVSWHGAHSVTVWSGHFREELDTLSTTWLLSECSSVDAWRSTSVGHDKFCRSFPQQHVASPVSSSAPDLSRAR